MDDNIYEYINLIIFTSQAMDTKNNMKCAFVNFTLSTYFLCIE